MCSFYVRRIWSPTSGFKSSSIQEGIVDSNQTLTNAVRYCIEIICPQLVGHQTASASVRSRSGGIMTSHSST
ncbi:hypothetical protein L207DRAFT_343336 [Hyaloscypha variabilis F]|uniref:Uncharacterized protein n=1 Tax=Hyaloscypha variabilis (strain UAMH 11265 / GT02V1 / F) TaxID=1149755 RepID=A0A2J6RQA0_HYAVF|nr:hypothetical protein L207DRAFT_343336 [Hyaloscypha variabilis F]